MSYRNLEIVRVIVKAATDLDISYAYDDLVFPDHTAFIIQYDDDNENNFFCYFHKDCNKKDQDKIFSNLTEASNANNCTISSKGSFYLEQKGEEVDIHFLN